MLSVSRGLSGGAISGFGLLRSAASPPCLLCRFCPGTSESVDNGVGGECGASS